MEALKKPFSVREQFDSLPEGTLAEFIDGSVCMSPAPSRMHQKISVSLSWAIRSHIVEQHKDCEIYPAPFDVFLENGEEEDVFQPDLSIVCDQNKLQDDGCHGAPEWIIEIVSPSTQHRDYALKLFKYRAAGVLEYWIVNPITETVTVYRFDDETQSMQYQFTDEISVGLCPGFSIRISDLIK